MLIEFSLIPIKLLYNESLSVLEYCIENNRTDCKDEMNGIRFLNNNKKIK